MVRGFDPSDAATTTSPVGVTYATRPAAVSDGAMVLG